MILSNRTKQKQKKRLAGDSGCVWTGLCLLESITLFLCFVAFLLICLSGRYWTQTAPDVLVGTLHGSHLHQCMNYCQLLWTKASAKCPKRKRSPLPWGSGVQIKPNTKQMPVFHRHRVTFIRLLDRSALETLTFHWEQEFQERNLIPEVCANVSEKTFSHRRLCLHYQLECYVIHDLSHKNVWI